MHGAETGGSAAGGRAAGLSGVTVSVLRRVNVFVREEEEGKEKETYDVLTNSLLDDELDEYINKLTNSIKQL